MPATSIFAYPLTRKYPSHFTWIILVGGVVFATLFTFVAVAGNGYSLESTYTSDVNETIKQKEWFQKSPFTWTADMETKCEPVVMTVGSEFMTTNEGLGGFRYTINHFSNITTISVTDPVTIQYLGAPLTDCEVRMIVIEMVRSNDGRLPRNYWAWDSTFSHSTIDCMMETDQGALRVNLTHQLPPAARRSEIGDSFLATNISAHPGRYIGSRLLQAWLIQLSTAMGYSAPDSGDLRDEDAASWGSGTISLARNNATMDYKSLEFFTCDTAFRDNKGGLSHMHPPHTMQNWHDQWTPEAIQGKWNAALPNISIVVDVFAKTYYSLLLSDFDSNNETKLVNALSTAEGLNYLQNVNNTDLAEVKAILGDKGDGTIGDYTKNSNLTQPLDFSHQTALSSRYLCSVPQRKSTFKLLFAVVLADIVFLSACWTVFGWVATWWLGRKGSDVDHCTGCINATHDIPLALATNSVGGGSYSRVSSDADDGHGGSQGRTSAPQIARVHSGV